MKTARLAASLVLVSTAFLVGCGPRENPCNVLPPPTPAQIEATQGGAEVEFEIESSWGVVECVLVGNAWVPESDH